VSDRFPGQGVALSPPRSKAPRSTLGRRRGRVAHDPSCLQNCRARAPNSTPFAALAPNMRNYFGARTIPAVAVRTPNRVRAFFGRRLVKTVATGFKTPTRVFPRFPGRRRRFSDAAQRNSSCDGDRRYRAQILPVLFARWRQRRSHHANPTPPNRRSTGGLRRFPRSPCARRASGFASAALSGSTAREGSGWLGAESGEEKRRGAPFDGVGCVEFELVDA